MFHSSLRRRMALLVVAVALVAGCSTKTDNGSKGTTPAKDEGPPQSGGTFNIGLDAETDGWNPTASQWAGAAYSVGQTVFDPLVAFGADNKTHPVLAKSVTPNAANTVWTIKLRPGITFHDGEPLNAKAVKLQLDKDKASFLVGQAFRPMKSVDVVDNLTVKVNMSQPWVAFTSALAGQAGFVAAPKQLNASGAGATDHPIGTGPYVFKEWVRDDHLTVTKNPKYWRKGVTFPAQITFRVIPDDQTRLASLQSGQLDLMSTIVASTILQARRDSSLHTQEADTDPTTMIMFNTAVAPFSDLRLRQAVSYAIDQKQLIQTVGRGLGKQSHGPYLPGSPWYGPNGYPTKPDLTKAKSLVAAYKRDKGVSGDVKFTLGCTPTPSNTQAMELIKTQLSKAGINANLKYTEQATYINNALQGNFQANCWVQLGASDPDGDSIWWNSTNANPVGSVALNFMRLKDPKIDAALQEGRTNPDVAKRKAAYDDVWKRFAADVPYAWLAHARISVMWSARTHGIGDAKLPDGTKPLLFRGAIPTVIPLSSIWLSR
ncbi:MAG: ABC transporter substrate-binding protein [Actinomycetota bacterium]|nr:ABC transporter substrate-binding protein [Actinomycetota bacterium]